MRMLKVCFIVAGALLASGCGYNRIQQQDEAVKAAWSEVINQYQRRADLVPNLVNTVKGFAAHETEVYKDIDDARAALDKGQQILDTKMPKPESADLGAQWPNWMTARLLLREARSLVPAPPASPRAVVLGQAADQRIGAVGLNHRDARHPRHHAQLLELAEPLAQRGAVAGNPVRGHLHRRHRQRS